MTHTNLDRVMFVTFITHIRSYRRILKQSDAPLPQTIIHTRSITDGR